MVSWLFMVVIKILYEKMIFYWNKLLISMTERRWLCTCNLVTITGTGWRHTMEHTVASHKHQYINQHYCRIVCYDIFVHQWRRPWTAFCQQQQKNDTYTVILPDCDILFRFRELQVTCQGRTEEKIITTMQLSKDIEKFEVHFTYI